MKLDLISTGKVLGTRLFIDGEAVRYVTRINLSIDIDNNSPILTVEGLERSDEGFIVSDETGDVVRWSKSFQGKFSVSGEIEMQMEVGTPEASLTDSLYESLSLLSGRITTNTTGDAI